MKRLKLRWTGIRPLIMSNPQTVQVSNPYAVAGRALNKQMKEARRKGNDTMMAEIERKQIHNDWYGSAYWDSQQQRFYIPDTMVLECLKKGVGRMAKDVDRAVIVDDEGNDDVPTSATCIGMPLYLETVVEYRNAEEAFKDTLFRIECPCRVPPRTGPLIWKCRCMIPVGWRVTVPLLYDETVIDEATLLTGGADGGRTSGLGAWRPKFGRFNQEFWNEVKQTWDAQFQRVEAPKAKRIKKSTTTTTDA